MSEELNEVQPVKKKCTFLFNVVLTLLVLYASFSSWLFCPVNNKGLNISDFPWSDFPYGHHLHLVVSLCIFFISLFVSSLIIMLIWNRLIANLFPIRRITYAEAYTAFLGLSFIIDCI